MIQHLHFDTFLALAVLLTTICVFQEFKLQNIVGSCDVKFPIRLEGLAYSHGIFSSVCFQHTQQTDSPPCVAFPIMLMLSMMQLSLQLIGTLADVVRNAKHAG